MANEPDVEEMDADSSTASDQDDKASTAEAAKPEKAESSAATDETEGPALSIVRDVVDARKAKPEAAPSAEGDEAGESGDDPTPKKTPDNEAYSDVPFNKHPRFQQLLRERNTFKGDADRYKNIENFLAERGLDDEEAADALITAALMKSNPAEAWKRMKPAVQKLLQAAGEVVPEDLQKRVDAGELSLEAAKEVSRSRAAVEAVQTQRTFEQQQAERRQGIELQNSITNAVTGWENDRRQKDPHFEAKSVPLHKEIAYLHATEGRPKDAAGALDQLKRAYKAVNAQIASVTPVQPQARRPAVRPITGGQVAGNAGPRPESSLDIIKDVVARRRSA